MAGRNGSPGRGAAHGQLDDVGQILKRLKSECAELRSDVQSAGQTYFKQFTNQLNTYDGAIRGLTDTLEAVAGCLRNGDGESIPARAGILKALEHSSDAETGVEEDDVGKCLRHLVHEVQDCKLAYHAFSVAAKDIVNDADKMDIVVKACQAEFIKLKLTTNNIKARLNHRKIKLIAKGRAFHEWAEMVHFETIECLRREMEEIDQDAIAWRETHAEAWSKAQAEWDALMSGNRRIKVAMMLKKMKNSRYWAAFATWSEAIWAIKAARAEAERQAILDDLQRRFGHLSKEQIEAKLRQFIKRWKNAKSSPAFRSWKDMVAEAKQARSNAELEAELAAMRAKLAGMRDNAALAKLKLYFQRQLQGVKYQTFRALNVHCAQQKARAMLDSEAGKRIKAFLKAKLAGIGRQCWQAWLQHHDNIAAENIKNNENAKKVGIMLEKIARSLVHRIFSAFGRHAQEMAEERAAGDALASKLAMMDDLYKAKLRVFLDAKRLGKMSTFFKHWSNVTANRGANALYEEMDKETELMRLLAARLAEAEAALSGQGRHSSDLQRTIVELNGNLQVEFKQHSSASSTISTTDRKTKEMCEMVSHERASRSNILSEIDGLERELRGVDDECEQLKGELKEIGMKVGFCHDESETY